MGHGKAIVSMTYISDANVYPCVGPNDNGASLGLWKRNEQVWQLCREFEVDVLKLTAIVKDADKGKPEIKELLFQIPSVFADLHKEHPVPTQGKHIGRT